MNFKLTMACLNVILLSLILGSAMIATTFIPYLEKVLIHISVFYPYHWHLKDLIKKNLNAHRKRNEKTAKMLLVAVAFIVFGSSMFQLLADFLISTIKMFQAADINVTAFNPRWPLNEVLLTAYLKKYDR
eukprot:UN02473